MANFNREELQDRKLSDFSPRQAAPSKNAKPQIVEEEDYGEEEDEGGFFSRVRVLAPVVLIAIVCFISYAWYTDKFAISKNDSDIPFIKANKEDFREKPEDPGGMRIVNRDKRVYDAISGKDNADYSKPENILPAPEKPIPREQIAALNSSKPLIQNKDTENSDIANIEPSAAAPKPDFDYVKEKEDKLGDNTDTSEDNKAAESKEVVRDGQDKKRKEEGSVTKLTQQDVKEVTTSDITDVKMKKINVKTEARKSPSGYRIQLGSYRSMGDAEISWKNLKKKFPKITKDVDYYIEKADLGAKGVFYRLQFAGFESEKDARKTCQTLMQKRQECFFVGK